MADADNPEARRGLISGISSQHLEREWGVLSVLGAWQALSRFRDVICGFPDIFLKNKAFHLDVLWSIWESCFEHECGCGEQ
jgi:hypothetical protein